DRHKAVAELIALGYLDQVGVVLRPRDAECQQLLQHDRHFHAVRCRQGIQLQRMPAERQSLLMRGTCDRTIDTGEAAAVLFGIPLPDTRWRVVTVCHGAPLRRLWIDTPAYPFFRDRS